MWSVYTARVGRERERGGVGVLLVNRQPVSLSLQPASRTWPAENTVSQKPKANKVKACQEWMDGWMDGYTMLVCSFLAPFLTGPPLYIIHRPPGERALI